VPVSAAAAPGAAVQAFVRQLDAAAAPADMTGCATIPEASACRRISSEPMLAICNDLQRVLSASDEEVARAELWQMRRSVWFILPAWQGQH